MRISDWSSDVCSSDLRKESSMNDTAHRGMKAKTIKAILAKKFNSFASSIEDEVVRKLVEKNTIITGGCIESMLLGEKINDFDLYFTDHATTKAVAEYYVKRIEVKHRTSQIGRAHV